MAAFNHYFNDDQNIMPAVFVPFRFIQKSISSNNVLDLYNSGIVASAVLNSFNKAVRGLL